MLTHRSRWMNGSSRMNIDITDDITNKSVFGAYRSLFGQSIVLLCASVQFQKMSVGING